MRDLHLIILFLMFTGPMALAQQLPSAEALLQESRSYYERHGQFQAKGIFKVYRGWNKTELLAQDEMITWRNFETIYTSRSGVEYLYNDGKLLTIDHSKKSLQINTSGIEGQGLNFVNVTAYLNYFETKEVIDKGTFYQITLSTPALTQLPYTTLVLDIDKNTHALIRQDFVMAGGVLYTDSNGKQKRDHKRLEITITDFKTKDFSWNLEQLKQTYYVTRVDQKWRATSQFGSYTITDRTIK